MFIDPECPLFDPQANGFAGVDFQKEELSLEELERAARALREHRTGRIFLTLITDDIERLRRKFARIEQLRSESNLLRETIVGYHLEGPYLSPTQGYCGAHPGDMMRRPDWAEFAALQKAAGGNIRLVTIAPEWEGSVDFIAAAVNSGVEVSLGHTNASAEEIEAAAMAGARFCTHVGNGVPQDLARHDNVIQRLLARDDLFAMFIPDGIHLPPFVLRNFVRAKPEPMVFFTTDCMAAAGAPPGKYSFAHLTLEVGEDRVVREPGKPNLAGSALTPDSMVDNLVEWLGWSREKATRRCSTDLLGLFFKIQGL